MPTLLDLVRSVSFLAAMPAVAGLLITAGILVVARDWRLNVIALTVQYFFGVLLLTRQIQLEVAAVKGLIGWLICMVFYLTERRAGLLEQAAEGEVPVPAQRWQQRWMMSARASFHLLAVILIAVAAYTAALRIPLPETEVPRDITLACYLLAGLGALLIGISESPMQVGLGLLTFLSGFDLFYVALEPSLAVAGLLGGVSFLIALAAAYLRTVQATVAAEEGAS
jgi:hypothetical protein